MAAVVNRTTVQYIASANTPDFPLAQWIHNPDLSLLLGLVAQRYWKVVGDTVVEMTAGEKTAVDDAAAAAKEAARAAAVPTSLRVKSPDGSEWSVTITDAGVIGVARP
jgi:hypothetical protein